jgi:hypothetical protein
MALITTSAGVDSNSYQTLLEANAYFVTRLHTAVWTAATDNQKEAALIWATRILDVNIQWNGIRQTELQALAWPRMNVYDADGWVIRINVIPKELKWAQAELAQLLLADDRMVEVSAKGMKELWIDRFTRFVFDKEDMQHVIPEFIVTLVAPFGTYIGNEALGGNGIIQLVRG